ncbi:MAG: DegT/DnrJ/EryC1/StrS family aminotransferase [Deltaproteobacteria bacterium]|nr:DegT/DnrJ/EryC1/StrS family aminotransferase [Deltaproteobacteria bacterium]
MKLAINGGAPVRKDPFPPYRVIGQEEKDGAMRVLDSGRLSGFLGAWHEYFYGGPEVRGLEEEWAKYFSVKHAITVNSATSGLFAAIGAIGIEPGDEVIVTPYSMSASAVAPLVYGAIPVFADIEPDHFCLDVESIKRCITSRTKAIIIVDLFGLPYDAEAVRAVAKEHGLKIIEDAAQAPYASYKGKFAGTLGDIGIFSLNYHKHIHCGEGGVIVTDDDELAERLQLIRNHAESVVVGKGVENISNMLGFNYRMTELEAAVARAQLKKLAPLAKERQANAAYLTEKLKDLPCLTPPKVRTGCEHVYYLHAIRYDKERAGVPRDKFIEALKAELPAIQGKEKEGHIRGSYVKPIYLQPMFQKRIAMGSGGFPWSAFPASNPSYQPGTAPVCEKMFFEELIIHEHFTPPFSRQDLDDVVAAFYKVWECRGELA